MKPIFLLFIGLCITLMLQAQVSKTIEVTAGGLKDSLTEEELNTITELTLTGTIDARDFKTMRDDMTLLAEIDLSGTKVVAYTGTEGTSRWSTEYNSNTIPQSAFNFKMLTSVILPPSVTVISNGAFNGCAGLTSVTIPGSVTSIGGWAFTSCTGLTTVTIPSSVSEIGDNAFASCTGLTSVSIPNSVTEIGNSAFDGCTSLVSVTIPNSVTSIGYNAFIGCTGLTSVTIPSGVIEIGDKAFASCTGLKEFIVDEDNTQFCSVDGVLFSKDKKRLISYPNGKGSNYEIPNSVTEIGDAFASCTGLISVTIPSSVAEIGRGAFIGCTGLTSVTIPSSVAEIGDYAFASCTGLTTVTIPSSVSEIGDNAFASCTGLTSVSIPNSVTEIGNSAFDGCTSLVSVTIPNSVTSIGYNAFSFTGLVAVTIPNSVTSIGDYCFYRCTGLKEFIVAEDNTQFCSVDGVLFSKNKKRLISYPNGKGGNYEIPSSVSIIYNYNFSGCTGLVSVTIPNSVTSILHYAFAYCTGLTSIYANSVYPVNLRYSNDVFNYVDKTNCILYVPYGSKAAYQAANQWKDFTNIVELPDFKLSYKTLYIADKQDSTAFVAISSNTSWTASCDQNWLTLSQNTGTGDQMLTFTADANPNTSPRIATVIISVDGVESQTITITQEAGTTALPDLAENSTQIKCYPNPFTDQITIEIQNSKRVEISVDIYNLAGERIKSLAIHKKDEKLDLKWNGTNDSGQRAVLGVYLCKVNNRSKQLIYLGQKGKN